MQAVRAHASVGNAPNMIPKESIHSMRRRVKGRFAVRNGPSSLACWARATARRSRGNVAKRCEAISEDDRSPFGGLDACRQRVEEAAQTIGLKCKVDVKPTADRVIAADQIALVSRLREKAVKSAGRFEQPVRVQIAP